METGACAEYLLTMVAAARVHKADAAAPLKLMLLLLSMVTSDGMTPHAHASLCAKKTTFPLKI